MNLNPQELKKESIEELEIRKMNLVSDIQALGKTKEGLDEVILNHEAQEASYTALEGDIEAKKAIQEALQANIKELINNKTALTTECEALEGTIEEKTRLTEEIAQLRITLTTLGKQHTAILYENEDLKKKSAAHLQATKDKLSLIHATVGNVLTQL